MNGLMIFSYGTIRSMDDIAAFYDHLTYGNASKEMVEKGYHLFRSIGTCDPLASTTNRIGRSLCRRLKQDTKEEWKYYIASKHTYPFVEDAVEQCVKDGIRKLYTVSLTPLYSKTGTRVYEKMVVKAVNKHGRDRVSVTNIPVLYTNESLIHLLADRLNDAINWLPKNIKGDAEIVFTSHSMPGDRTTQKDFIRQYENMASEIIKRVPYRSYRLAYRSASPGEAWLKPDMLDVIRSLAKEGKKAVVVCELLSIIKNAEVIQEVGRDGMRLAHLLGMEFVQTEYLNDSDDFMNVLTDHVLEEIKQPS